MNSKRTMQCATLILASILSVVAESADGATETLAWKVSFADLNMKSAAGVEALYRRIEYASSQVCEKARETRQVRRVHASKECQSRATERAVLQVGLPALTKLHLARGGRLNKPTQLAAE